jgi:hypothetical protein
MSLKLPSSAIGSQTGYGQSPLQQVSPTNLLMAAAQMGEGEDPNRSSPSPKDPHPSTKQKRVKRLKMVR